MNKIPRYEKVDKNTIRIVIEHAEDVPLAELIDNRRKLLEQKVELRKDLVKQEKVIDETVKNIDKIVAEGKKLGITAKEKPNINAKPDQVTLGVKQTKENK